MLTFVRVPVEVTTCDTYLLVFVQRAAKHKTIGNILEYIQVLYIGSEHKYRKFNVEFNHRNKC
jgi:hypothetical protein